MTIPEARTDTESAVRAGAAVTAAFGFVLVVSANPRTDTLGTLSLTVVVLLATAAAGLRVVPGRAVAAAAGFASLVSLWLVPQRNDVAAAVILAALFGAGIGVLADAPALSYRARRSWLGVGAGCGALLVVRFAGSQVLLAWCVGAFVVAALVATLAQRPARGRRASRFAAVGVSVVALVTVIFAGYVGAETPDASWFGGGTVHGPTRGNEVALTFDDGPNVGTTERVLAILDRYGVKGTFFEVGKAIDADPAITRAVYDDGHLLGNHSYDHDQWRWLDPRYPELQRTQAAFARAIGVCPVLYRPPHGDRTPFLAHVVDDHHMHMVLWSASAGDWATTNARLVARRILHHARPGAILLLHDGLDGKPGVDRSVLVRALPIILDGLRAKGLHPVRLDTMLHTGAYQRCGH